MIIQSRTDLKKLSYPTSWSKQINIKTQTRLFSALSSCLIKTLKNQDPTACPDIFLHWLITFTVNILFSLK